MTTTCRCNDATEFYGTEAEAYAREHHRSQETRSDAFEEVLTCPDTGAVWKLEFPERTERDPGPARLARTD
jgi:hypothetical protein